MDANRELLAGPTRLSAAQIKERGWTEALVHRFPGEPDLTRPNPRYRSAAPMRLYDLARVEAAESTEEFATALTAAVARSARAKEAARHQKEALLAAIEAVPISVRRIAMSELRELAIDDYNAWNCGRLDKEPASDGSDPDFLRRITRNFVRHRLCNYDEILGACSGQVGIALAYSLLRDRVEAEIDATYPELSAP
jgi:hypothetical protein